MIKYGLYLESGPQRRKTMVHVIDLLGCVAVGPTTEDALAATSEAVRQYRRFLVRCGEQIDPEEPFETEVVEHVAEAGRWLGNGSPYVTYGPDLEPVREDEVELLLNRFNCLRRTFSEWAAAQTEAALDAKPEAGRTARAILMHVLSVPGGQLSAALGTVSGFSRLQTLTERGELPLPDALMQVDALVAQRVRTTTPEERAAVRQRPKELRTLRKALRHILEHDWEHFAELSRRPGGPTW